MPVKSKRTKPTQPRTQPRRKAQRKASPRASERERDELRARQVGELVSRTIAALESFDATIRVMREQHESLRSRVDQLALDHTRLESRVDELQILFASLPVPCELVEDSDPAPPTPQANPDDAAAAALQPKPDTATDPYGGSDPETVDKS